MIISILKKSIKNILFRVPYQFKIKRIGKNSYIKYPLKINGYKNIIIENDVIVEAKTWLAAVPHTNEEECSLLIQEGCRIGHFNHIYATKTVILEKYVLTADKVYISDNLHSYEDINLPILKQPIKQNKIVVIGQGTWIGENACILGVTIGKNCVIGANSVVNKDIPDYCVAVGIPAKVIKRYCIETGKWELTNPDGSFKLNE